MTLLLNTQNLCRTTRGSKSDLCLQVQTIYTIDILNWWPCPGGQRIQYGILQIVPVITRPISSRHAFTFYDGSTSETRARLVTSLEFNLPLGIMALNLIAHWVYRSIWLQLKLVWPRASLQDERRPKCLSTSTAPFGGLCSLASIFVNIHEH